MMFRLLFALALGASASASPITYAYQGNLFTDTTAPYQFGDAVSGKFTLSAPLPADSGLVDYSSSIQSIQFTDGFQTISYYQPDGAFFLRTVNNQIYEWNIVLSVSCCGIPFLSDVIMTQKFFNADHVVDYGSNPGANKGYAFVGNQPGTWTVLSGAEAPPPTSSSPEPSTIAMLGFGLTVIARKAAAARLAR